MVHSILESMCDNLAELAHSTALIHGVTGVYFSGSLTMAQRVSTEQSTGREPSSDISTSLSLIIASELTLGINTNYKLCPVPLFYVHIQ